MSQAKPTNHLDKEGCVCVGVRVCVKNYEALNITKTTPRTGPIKAHMSQCTSESTGLPTKLLTSFTRVSLATCLVDTRQLVSVIPPRGQGPLTARTARGSPPAPRRL